MTKRKTLWTWGMPTPDLGRNWRHDGSVYYVDVTDEYVPAEQLRAAVDLLREIGAMAGAKANGADARAMAKRAREFVASLHLAGGNRP